MTAYPRRFAAALRAHWLAVTLGWATGLYVAFAACLGLMIADLAEGWELREQALAFAMDVILLVGMLGGGLVGYTRRRGRVVRELHEYPERVYYPAFCRTCGEHFEAEESPNYCPECGDSNPTVGPLHVSPAYSVETSRHICGARS